MADDSSVNDDVQELRTVIGIAFGNSYSSIAYISDDKAEVIANEEGDRQIPSILSYVEGDEVHGTQAKAQVVRNPRNTIAFFREFIGKRFEDVDVSPCHASAHPMALEETVAFKVEEMPGTESTLTVSEVVTRHLRRLRQSAEDFLGKKVDAAVFTVPANFSDDQIKALSVSAEAAGIEPFQFISEPVAALLAHETKQQMQKPGSPVNDQIALVADLGGTRSDISVVASRAGIYTTLATVHDYEFCGQKLDQVLVDYAAKEFLKKNKEATDPRKTAKSLAKLTREAESVKKALSLGSTATFSIEGLVDGLDFTLSVNRSRFELLANKEFMSLQRMIESAVEKAGMDVLDIDEILLAGGTSHIPRIAANLKTHFPDSAVIAPSTSPSAVNPSELIARGGAIQANLVCAYDIADVQENTQPVITVASHTSKAIGIVDADGSFTTILPEHSSVPARRTCSVPVPKGGDVLVRIAEGKREIIVTKAEATPKNDSEDDDSDEESEPAEIRSKAWTAGKVLTEACLRDVPQGGKVRMQLDLDAKGAMTLSCMIEGKKGGVRGSTKVEVNGA
ncbi:heat shock 70 kd protein cognate 1 [Piedraia hortae CBS 480.64]|uniref:Heat shock 70 kd protein cognate 1 n=1 Tax=Piedraia hortae CBS 480.64 TaxID=1314780 RepID=A0A6A7C3D1_9PEZI|nr:heat shock 70 kd protein cognate 1 [Piedraia hortae CBS 480.64]